jgi:hypothetical protein
MQDKVKCGAMALEGLKIGRERFDTRNEIGNLENLNCELLSDG